MVLVPFAEAFEDVTGGQVKVKKRDFKTTGIIPVIDQGQEEIGGYTDNIDSAFVGELPVILFGDHTRSLKYVTEPFALGADGVKVLSPKDGFEPEFLFYYLTSVNLPSLGYSRHFKLLREILVPKPPVDYQLQVIDILNRADSIRRSRREAITKARELIPALFVDMFGGPFPHGPLRDVVTVLSGATPSKKEPRFWGGDISWVSAKDMKVDQISTSQDHVTNAALTETNLKLVPENSILIVVRGMILAHTVPIALNVRPLTINQDLKALLPGDNVKSTYLHWALKCSHSELLARVSTAAHGTRKLDTDRLMSLQVPVPPIELQDEFSRRAEDLISVANNQERMAEQADTLMASLMHQLFNGEANESLAAELEAAAS